MRYTINFAFVCVDQLWTSLHVADCLDWPIHPAGFVGQFDQRVDFQEKGFFFKPRVWIKQHCCISHVGCSCSWADFLVQQMTESKEARAVQCRQIHIIVCWSWTRLLIFYQKQLIPHTYRTYLHVHTHKKTKFTPVCKSVIASNTSIKEFWLNKIGSFAGSYAVPDFRKCDDVDYGWRRLQRNVSHTDLQIPQPKGNFTRIPIWSTKHTILIRHHQTNKLSIHNFLTHNHSQRVNIQPSCMHTIAGTLCTHVYVFDTSNISPGILVMWGRQLHYQVSYKTWIPKSKENL